MPEFGKLASIQGLKQSIHHGNHAAPIPSPDGIGIANIMLKAYDNDMMYMLIADSATARLGMLAAAAMIAACRGRLHQSLSTRLSSFAAN